MNKESRVVLITGASMGIGHATAFEFANENFNLSICARHKTELDDSAKQLQERGAEVLSQVCDISDDSQVKAFVENTFKKYGRVDVLVNNAAILNWDNFLDTPLPNLQEEINVNLKGTVNMCWEVGQIMKKQKEGTIINISSVLGKNGKAEAAVYSATKHAILGLTKSLAANFSQYKINVYAVCPGAVKTRMSDFTGIEPEVVAGKIMDLSLGKLGINSGENITVE